MNTRYKTYNINCILILLLVVISVVAPSVVQAAELYFIPPDEPIYQGDVFSIEVRVDSAAEAINAVQADVEFNPNLFEVISADNTNSILNFWPRTPSFNNESGEVLFSAGLANPGFQGSRGLIGTITLKAENRGRTSLNFLDTSRALLNDGLGTEAFLETRSTTLNVLVSPEDYQPKKLDLFKDTISPDVFTPIISSSKYIYDGKYFVAFETQDHESGISHFEVQEKTDEGWGEWRIAISPHMLENQKGSVTVFVKAVDKAGNERIGVSEVSIPKKEFYLLYILLVVVFLVALIVITRHKISRLALASYQKVKFWRQK